MSFPPSLMRFFPFLRWFPYQSASLRADFLAGLTVALVLVPQSMAYAQLAGMPARYFPESDGRDECAADALPGRVPPR